MNRSIKIAAIAILIMVVFNLLGMIYSKDFNISNIARILMLLLLILGMIKRYKIVWEWGRLLTILYFGWVVILTILNLKGETLIDHIFILIFIGLPSLAIFISFGTDSAREHFNLICPQCSSMKIKSNDFLFKKTKCKKCNTIW